MKTRDSHFHWNCNWHKREATKDEMRRMMTMTMLMTTHDPDHHREVES